MGPHARMKALAQKGVAWVQRLGLPLVLACALYFFLRTVHKHYPVEKWLFWRYGACVLLSAAFALACLSTGHVVVHAILGTGGARRSGGLLGAARADLPTSLPVLEHLAASFGAGVYVFFLAMMLGGMLGLYGAIFFVAAPLAMALAGAVPFARWARRVFRHARAVRSRAPAPPLYSLLPHLVGLVGLAMVYFVILAPENTAFDARWQHLAIAEHYVAEGAVRRFPEGWYVGASPHLASFLYTWAFMRPRAELFDHVELAAHLEFTAFLFTLLGIPALVRRLAPGAGGAWRYAWAARFLFPGVLLYDSSLCLGADHVAALFAVPIYALAMRAWRTLSPRVCVLLAMMLSGAILTKYTGALVLVGAPILAIALRALIVSARTLLRRPDPRVGKRWFLGPLAALGAGLAFTAPHWLKNLFWYGDPMYPLLHARFTPRPWTPDSADRFEYGFVKAQLWRPERTWKGVKESLGACFTFSFVPNDWPKFHGKVPLFGSLFTLSLGALPFLRRTGRLWAIFAAVHLGVFSWYWTHHQDRYLQAILPWMAAATAGVLALAWQRGRITKLTVLALVGAQLVWGGDAWFIPGHAMEGSAPKAVIELLGQGYKKNYENRLDTFAGFTAVAKVLPPGAKLLVHEEHPHAGLGVPTVNDYAVNQGGISYGRLTSPRAVYELLRGYGVTHLLWPTKQGALDDTLAADLVFFNFVTRHGVAARSIGGFTLAAMPAEPPPEGVGPDPIAILSCKSGFSSGLYHLPEVHVPVFGPLAASFPAPFRPAPRDDPSIVAAAAAVAVETGCGALPANQQASFTMAATRRPYDLYIRTSGVAQGL